MHGIKGLEFQAVAVIEVAAGVVPAPSAVTGLVVGPVAHVKDLQRERCMLFVALVRARDHLYSALRACSSLTGSDQAQQLCNLPVGLLPVRPRRTVGSLVSSAIRRLDTPRLSTGAPVFFSVGNYH